MDFIVAVIAEKETKMETRRERERKEMKVFDEISFQKISIVRGRERRVTTVLFKTAKYKNVLN